MSLFKAEDGEEIYERSRKKTIVKNGKTYKRVPRPKYQSRSSRCLDAVSNIQSVKDSLEEIKSVLEEDDVSEEMVKEKIDEAKGLLEGIDSSEIGSLREEMESWRDNLQGTNLENSSKYGTIDECANNLSEAADTLDGISTDLSDDKESAISEIDQQISDLDEAISNLESCEFPGMFG